MVEISRKGVALVTGAGQGIGRAIALRLADDGFDVAVNDISVTNLAKVAEEIRLKGRNASSHVADVSVEDQVKAMIQNVVEALGSLDVMVANAGITDFKSILETSEEDWDRQFAVNAKGTFFCYKYAGAQMIAQGCSGRIIGASSIFGKQGGGKVAVYTSTKFAVRGLTQAAAIEFGPHGITVNAYAPGAIETPMLEYIEKITNDVNGVRREAWKSRSLVGRNGKPDEIASLVSFLASKESSFITGQTISCNGGLFFD